MVEIRAIYILWLREMKRFSRAKERIIGSLATPLLFFAFLGFGFSRVKIPGLPQNINYIHFLLPGIIGMNMLFSSMFGGMSVLWDKEFGFLKEIMVAPVSRVSIALGRIAGGATTGLIQGTAIFIISLFVGFSIPNSFSFFRILLGFLGMITFMVFIALTFISVGLSFASNMRDAEGFGLIVNFFIFPTFFLSGAVSPIVNFPSWLRVICYLNPLTYGVDGIRRSLIGASMFPVSFDILICLIASIIMVSVAGFFFDRSSSL